MIKKIILIIFVFSAYIYLVSSDPKGSLITKSQKMYTFWMSKYKKLNLKYHVNRWPDSKPKKKYY